MPKSVQSPILTSGMSVKQTADATLDITGYLCPMTFVRTRLALDRLAPGQVLEVRLKGDEPRANVPRTAIEQGHAVLAQTDMGSGEMVVLIRKGGRGG